MAFEPLPLLALVRGVDQPLVNTTEVDEVKIILDALAVAWLFAPDYWLGLDDLVHTLATRLPDGALSGQDLSAVELLKEIGNWHVWPNNTLAGLSLASKAKSSLRRLETGKSFDHCTVVASSRRSALHKADYCTANFDWEAHEGATMRARDGIG